MDPSILAYLIICIFTVAILYSCVGHGGASGYIAVMTIVGLTPMVIKPTALMLNIMVSAIASVQFYRAGYFRWSVFWRFALTSIPFAFIGGYYVLPAYTYKYIIVFILWFSAVQLFVRPVIQTNEIRLPSCYGVFSGEKGNVSIRKISEHEIKTLKISSDFSKIQDKEDKEGRR